MLDVWRAKEEMMDTLSEGTALGWLKEFGTVTVDYDYVEFSPHYRHGESIRINTAGSLHVDDHILARLYRAVQASRKDQGLG